MSLSSPPDEIVSLNAIIAATAAWTAQSGATVYWANAQPSEFPATAPITVTFLKGNREAGIIILGGLTMTEAEVTALARDVAFQIQTRYRADMTGLHIPKEPTVGEVGEPSEAMKTAGDGRHAVQIDLSYGISLE